MTADEIIKANELLVQRKSLLDTVYMIEREDLRVQVGSANPPTYLVLAKGFSDELRQRIANQYKVRITEIDTQLSIHGVEL